MFFNLALVLLNTCVELGSDETKKSHDVELSDQEFQLIEALKENPEMLDQFTSITQKFNQEVESGMDAHEAECHVIKSIQELGRSMISKWAQKTQTEAVKEACRSEKKHQER
jgi:hypothetical protein